MPAKSSSRSAPFQRFLFLMCNLLAFGLPTNVYAQEADTIVVFDGSGSMWGQIEGRTKIEIARETLSSVLREIEPSSRIGMIAYGHRQKGACSDIETVVPVEQASRSVPQMISVANGLQPKGKTPLSDAVRIAANELRFTENAATVILVTDGIETCDADPCALASELENLGVNFTTHVVGFGLSQDEGRQVQCLAENTGGLYLAAKDADELGEALRRTVANNAISPNEDDFGSEISLGRPIRFIFRDTDAGEQIGVRQLSGGLEHADGTPVENAQFQLEYPEAKGNSATAVLEPGQYVAKLQREGAGGSGYTARYAFEVPEGESEYLVEASLSGSLTLNLFINPNLPYVKGEAFPTAVGGSRPRFHFAIYPIVDGAKAEQPAATIAGADDLTRPLPPGTYLIQGNIDSGTSVERVVEVKPARPTVYDFSFDATRVFVDARETDGSPVKRQTTYWYDKVPSGRNYWVHGAGARDGDLQPFYLPTGDWVINVGGEGYGKRRSELVVTVPGDFRDLRLEVGEGRTLTEAEKAMLEARGSGCLEILRVVRDGCLVEKAQLSSIEPSGEQPAASETVTQKASVAPSIIFNNRSTKKTVLSFQESDAEAGRMILGDGWCGRGGCAARDVEVPAALMDAVRNGQTATFDLSENALRIFTAPGGFEDTLTVIENPDSNRPVKAVMVLAPEGQTMEPGKPVSEHTGVRLVFGDAFTGKRYVVIDYPPEADGAARIVLAEGWCGQGLDCAGSIAGLPAGIIDALEEGRTQTFQDSWGIGTVTVNPEGQRNFIEVAEKGKYGKFQLLERNGSGTGDKSSAAPAPSGNQAEASQGNASGTMSPPEEVSLDDQVNRVFGVFNINQTGASVDEVVGNYAHVDQCQRAPTVIWPDGTMARKQFVQPQGPDENPYKTVASGQCQISGTQFNCSITDRQNGDVQNLTFKSRLLGNNHYVLEVKDQENSWLAVSCFFPDGELRADTVMPNGRSLAELIMERTDAQSPGMGFDRNNMAFRGQ
ncbi:VWA domain-containing protein [Nitratireductor sp. B36]|uniref:vWA domain-containing protein n=1 Tax=Nitratireductor sp. B36 TaxID=2762059 RepID=UPI001E61B6FF|nr:VWA domain-containing protein [Nitratireductor sp. B36]